MEKYLIASSGDSLDSKVSGRFGHAGYFLLVDPVTLEYEAFMGITTYEGQEIEKFITASVKKVIVGNIGPGAFNEVTSYGCKIYLCRNLTVPEAINKVKNGEITPLGRPTLKSSIHSARKTGYKYGGHGENVSSGAEGRTSIRAISGRGMNRGSGRGPGRVRGNRIPAGRRTDSNRGMARGR